MDSEGFVYGANSLDLFVDRLQKFQNPLILDLGPVCEQNLDYLAGTNRFSVRVEDLSREAGGDLARAVELLSLEKSAFHGVLLWSLLDHLKREAIRGLVRRMWSALRPGGLVAAFFGQRQMPEAAVQQFLIRGRGMISIRETGIMAPCWNWPNREILDLFEPFETVNSFILKSGLREFLFRRPLSMTWDIEASEGRSGGRRR
jgi:hypothetical protein